MLKFIAILCATVGLLFLMKSFPIKVFAATLFMVPGINIAFTVGLLLIILFDVILYAYL